jgi:hypothetical protein
MTTEGIAPTPDNSDDDGGQRVMTGRFTNGNSRARAWVGVIINTPIPPSDWPYASAMWLLARHPRLARWAQRVPGVVEVETDRSAIERFGGLSVDLDLLATMFSSEARYGQLWEDYSQAHREPDDDNDDSGKWDRWFAAGPKADELVPGLSALLAMSSGERAGLRLLALLSSVSVPFKAGDLRSLDGDGQRLLADWCLAMQAY